MSPAFQLFKTTFRTEKVSVSSTNENTAILKGLVNVSIVVTLVILVSCQLPVVTANNLNPKPRVEHSETDSLNVNDDLQIEEIINSNDIDSQTLDDNPQHFTHQWAAHIVGGNIVADRIARKHGFINAGEVS